tara:strand:+ start:16 stop:435 length:420 start_codon:yes stop_codon:yes gene_type:complete
MTRSQIKKKLDTVFSQYVRIHGSNEMGWGECITCGRLKFWKEAHCGHFITRAKMSTRWLYEPDIGRVNVGFQCAKCNLFGQGQQYVFGRKLDERYGEGTAEKILYLSNQTKKWSVYELEDLHHYYKKKVEELKESRGLE